MNRIVKRSDELREPSKSVELGREIGTKEIFRNWRHGDRVQDTINSILNLKV